MLLDTLIKMVIFAIIVVMTFLAFAVFEGEIAKAYEETAIQRQSAMSILFLKKCLPKVVNFTNLTQMNEIRECVKVQGVKERINISSPWGDWLVAQSEDFETVLRIPIIGFTILNLTEIVAEERFPYPVAKNNEIHGGVITLARSK